MAGNATTHVIEIEKGVGEPTFIPLSLGQELAPISVGRRGMWRIEGAKVLDVHAFVYFDGQSLFFQSADSAQPAMADGAPIDTQWTEVRPPCRIEIGSARLGYRSLMAEQDGVATVAREVSTAERDAFAREVAARRSAAAAVPAPPAPPRRQQRSDRPFSHGELVNKRDDSESTRHNPIEQQPRAMPRRTASSNMPAAQPLTSPNDETRMRPASGPYPQALRPPSGAVPAFAPAPQGMGPPLMQPGSGPYPQPQMMGSGGYPQAGPYPVGMQPPGPLTGPGPMMMPGGAQTVLVHAGGGNKLDELAAQFNAASPARKASLMLAPFAVLAALYIFFSSDDSSSTARAPRPVGSTSTGIPTAVLTQGPLVPAQPQQQPYGVPQPQGFAPAQPPGTPTAGAPQQPQAGYPVGPQAQPTAVQPTMPQMMPSPPLQPQQLAPAPVPAPSVTQPYLPAQQPQLVAQPQPSVAPAPSAIATSLPHSALTLGAPRTLERMAVDALASGDQPGALALYAQLMRENPQNAAFADAVRILQSRVDAANPQTTPTRP